MGPDRELVILDQPLGRGSPAAGFHVFPRLLRQPFALGRMIEEVTELLKELAFVLGIKEVAILLVINH